MDFLDLKFLLKLVECKNHRTKLSVSFKGFKGSREICQELGKDGLVDFSKEIDSVGITTQGQSLLTQIDAERSPLDAKELKVLQKIAKTNGQLKSSAIKISGVSAKERTDILNSLVNQTWIECNYKLKQTGVEVWLTPKGLEHLKALKAYSQNLRQGNSPVISEPVIKQDKPTDDEVLSLIKNLEQEFKTNNYLPIFYLREKLEPTLARTDFDEVLYRLEDEGHIELSTLVHTENYTAQQLSAGIKQPVGGPIFFISVLG